MAEQVQQMINSQLAVANAELQQSLDQRFTAFRSEQESAMSQIVSNIAALRDGLDKVTNSADKTYEEQKRVVEDTVQRMNLNISRVDDEVVKSAKKIDEAHQSIKDHVAQANQSFQNLSTLITDRVISVERSLSTAVTVAQQSATGTSMMTTTLDNDKRFFNHPILNGDEEPAVLQEWWTKLMIKIEQAVPTSEEYLKSVVSYNAEVTNDMIEQGMNKAMGHRLNRKLCSLLTNKSTKKAWGHIKNYSST